MRHPLPLWTAALNCVVSVKGLDTNIEAVIRVSFQVEKGSVDHCHLTIVPVYAPKVSVPLEFPVQMVLPPVTEPPTEAGVTVILTTFDSPAIGQVASQVTLDNRLYHVVVVNDPGA